MDHYRKLAESIRSMSIRSNLYKLLKRELTIQGYWRNRPRGNPSKGYQAMKERFKR